MMAKMSEVRLRTDAGQIVRPWTSAIKRVQYVTIMCWGDEGERDEGDCGSTLIAVNDRGERIPKGDLLTLTDMGLRRERDVSMDLGFPLDALGRIALVGED